MPYVSEQFILDARKNIKINVNKPETFAGLMLFLFCVEEKKQQESYLKANMQEFQKLADKAFCFKNVDKSYNHKFWYGLLPKDWVFQTKTMFLKNTKVSALNFLVSLFWYMEFDNNEHIIECFRNKIGAQVFDELFYTEDIENFFINKTVCDRESLLKVYNGTREKSTVKYEGSLISKDASDLTSAPFAQTLYSSHEIKKIIWVADFDFIYQFESNDEIPQAAPIFYTSFSNLSKPFLLLAGVSGTGKTRFVREQVKTTGKLDQTYCLVPVRPDWHEPSDLLGYISRLRKEPDYIVTDVLMFLVKAWKEIVDAEVLVRDCNFIGHKNLLEKIRPFWLCLDEMNLAPVEQYFSDYLSVLETREWQWSSNQFCYSSEPLLKADIIKGLPNLGQGLRDRLGLSNIEYDSLWEYFSNYGIGLPFNLIVAGTVNMDETTHGFSRKVIDRALSIDFGEFFPNTFNNFFDQNEKPKGLNYPILSTVQKNDLNGSIDVDGMKSIEFLNEVNTALCNTPFKLAYRALNELLLSVLCHKPQDVLSLQAVWDDFLMCKILPRIEGDIDKLSSSNGEETLLHQIESILKIQLADIWGITARPDLYRDSITNPDTAIIIICRSEHKLAWMKARLNHSGFTSFWP
ncbi:McrB family protein [Acinetobacter guillouiae]|uniref:McrB family protein n=1 Tax=Acinetobacter guillouiae TaxID=106649 RepID=UPI003AF7B36B